MITKSNCPEWPRCGCGGQPCKLATKSVQRHSERLRIDDWCPTCNAAPGDGCKADPVTEWTERATDAIGDAQHLIHQGDFMTAVHALVRAAAACHESEAAKQRVRVARGND